MARAGLAKEGEEWEILDLSEMLEKPLLLLNFIEDAISLQNQKLDHMHQFGSDCSISKSLWAVHHQLCKLRIVDSTISI